MMITGYFIQFGVLLGSACVLVYITIKGIDFLYFIEEKLKNTSFERYLSWIIGIGLLIVFIGIIGLVLVCGKVVTHFSLLK